MVLEFGTAGGGTTSVADVLGMTSAAFLIGAIVLGLIIDGGGSTSSLSIGASS